MGASDGLLAVARAVMRIPAAARRPRAADPRRRAGKLAAGARRCIGAPFDIAIATGGSWVQQRAAVDVGGRRCARAAQRRSARRPTDISAVCAEVRALPRIRQWPREERA